MDLGHPSINPIKVLGAGTFGRVFLCNYRRSQKVCVKRIIVQNPKQDMKMIMEEVYIISQLRHPNVIQFIDSFIHAGTVNIIMEYAANGTLLDVIKKRGSVGFSVDSIVRYFCDILMGLEYLHIRHVFHRDLKPANLLIDIKNRIKIADFGISLIHNPNNATCNPAGTAFYSAPEVLRGENYDYKSDIWSLGCVLYEMCMGYSPFSQAKNVNHLLYLINSLSRQKLNCTHIRKIYGPLWANLCEKMVIGDLKQRISLPDILRMESSLTLKYYNNYFDYNY